VTRKKQVRIGIVGAGRFTNNHMAEFAKLPEVKVVAFCRRNAEALAKMQEQWNVAEGFTDHREMLAMDGLDAVDVVTPTDSHHPIVLDAIRAGKHVLCDKPLALNAAQCREMLAAAEKADIVHVTNFNQRGRTPVGRMQRYIADGYIGDLYHLDVWWGMSLQYDARPDILTWRFSPETGGGTVYELIHVFDIALFIGGPVKRLVAMLSTSEKRRPFADRPKGMDVRVPDSSGFLIEFTSGTTAVVHTSFVSRGTDPDGSSNVRVEASGSKGRIVTDGLYGLRGVSGKQGPLAPIDPGAPYPQPYEQFVAAILKGEPVRTSFKAGLEAARLVDAAYKSAASSSWVSL